MFLWLWLLPFVMAEDLPAPPPAPPPGGAPPPAVPTWSGCVDPQLGAQPVTIGKPTTVCLVLANNGDWSTAVDYLRLNFQPTADEYSRFRVPRSFQQLVGAPANSLSKIFDGNITVHAESQTALSFQKTYYDVGNNTIFPYLTAVVTVNEGNVTGITWDDACVFCNSDECVDNTFNYDGSLATAEQAQQKVGSCPMTVDECNLSDSAECDLMLYVVWTGTDSEGRDFTSSANRFSAFPKQSWSDRLYIGLPDWMDNINPFGNNNAPAATTDSN